jgi:hypothetical protein
MDSPGFGNGTYPADVTRLRAVIFVIAVAFGVLAGWPIVGLGSPPCDHSCGVELSGPVKCPAAPATGCPSNASIHWVAAIMIGGAVAFGISFVAVMLTRPRSAR